MLPCWNIVGFNLVSLCGEDNDQRERVRDPCKARELVLLGVFSLVQREVER